MTIPPTDRGAAAAVPTFGDVDADTQFEIYDGALVLRDVVVSIRRGRIATTTDGVMSPLVIVVRLVVRR
jgi:hypothetical protein